MRKMFLFMMVSLDGYIEGPGHDLSWHHVDGEFNDFAASQMGESDTILMGRRTYQLMEEFWPSEAGRRDDPVVAELMDEMPKVVVSRSLPRVTETKYWKNVTLVRDNVSDEIRKLKETKGKDIILLASNNLCVSLLAWGLLDEVRIMVNPVVIGKGTPLFARVDERVELNLKETRLFGNGNVLLTYTPFIS